MRLPHRIVGNSPFPRWFGHLAVGHPFAAWTFMVWICVPETTIAPQVLVHEQRHVEQFYAGWALGLTLWALFLPGWWWLLLTPFTYTVAYLAAGLYAMVRHQHFYRDNVFERDARRHAGEPV